MQVGLNQNYLDEYFSIVKEFMLQIHQRIDQGQEIPEIQSHLLSVIDRATVKIKTQKEHIQIMELQLKEAEVAKLSVKDIKNQCQHLERRFNQKCDQISILRETVKTLYQDNQRISGQKETMNKEIASFKEGSSSLKKKLKRQEDQILNHKHELKKLTVMTEDKIAEYIKDDEQKQSTIKRQTHQLQRLKSDLSKKEKTLSSANKKLDELKNFQKDCEKLIKLSETLKEQNNLLMTEVHQIKEKHLGEKSHWLRQTDGLKHSFDGLKQKLEEKKMELAQTSSKFACAQQKILNYQKQILMRTEKLKQKNKQVKLYSEQINKLSARVQQLSMMSDEILADNQELTDKCHGLEQRLEQLRTFQAYVTRIKGDMHNKKSEQLGKLMQSLTKLHSHS